MHIDVLRDAIFWAMRENLMIQFVYPDFELPQEMLDAIDTIDHTDIKHLQDADIIVCNGISDLHGLAHSGRNVVLRITEDELIQNLEYVSQVLKVQSYLSITLTDIDRMRQSDFDRYYDALERLSIDVCQQYVNGQNPRINILTERMLINSMNNCNAGHETITIGPNGLFYICPAFFYENPSDSVGDMQSGLAIQNQQLFCLDHAPICRKCDAYHCRRCVWLNRKMTLEVNTPSHEQCVVSHIERNASRNLLSSVRKYGEFLPSTQIEEIDYLDPFDKYFNK
jgi:CXXX repeat peptide maturase